MIYNILLFALIIECCVAYKNPKYAVGVCFAIITLFPNLLKFNVGINLNSFNLAVFVIVFSMIKKILRTSPQYLKLCKLILFYVVYVAITSLLFGLSNITMGEYVQNMILLLMEFGFIAYVMCWLQMSAKEIRVFNNILIPVIIIVILYGIFNYLTKMNPYITYISLMTDVEDQSMGYMNEQRGFLDGRISSVFYMPLILGQWVLIVFSYVYYEFRNKWNPFFYYLLLGGLFLCSFLTGSRSSLLPLLMVPVIYLLHSKPEKIIRYFLVTIFCISLTFPFLPEKVQDYAETTVFFWDDKAASKADVRGSSKEGRIEQFQLAVATVSDNPLFGKGFNYNTKHRDDLPRGLYGLESIFLSHMIDGGIIGLLVFLLYFFRLYFYLRKQCHSSYDKAMVDSLCIPFFISMCLTGILYSIFCFFMMFYMITLYKISNTDFATSI